MSSTAAPVRKPGLFERLWRGGPPRPSAAGPPSRPPGLVQLIDWRLVTAVGLPLWAFAIGFVVAQRIAPPASQPVTAAVVPEPTAPNPPDEPIPAPREVVVRTEIVTVPVAVPIPVPAEPVVAAPAEFTLPPSEVLPADRCKTFDTKIRFHAGLPEAAAEAKHSKKMLLVLHISGNFDDPGFT